MGNVITFFDIIFFLGNKHAKKIFHLDMSNNVRNPVIIVHLDPGLTFVHSINLAGHSPETYLPQGCRYQSNPSGANGWLFPIRQTIQDHHVWSYLALCNHLRRLGMNPHQPTDADPTITVVQWS